MARFVLSGVWKDKAVKDAIKGIRGLTKETSVFAKKSKAAWGAAAVAATYYGKRALKDSIQNALADEKAQRSLALTLKNVASATDLAVYSTEAQITQMGKLYGLSDDVLRPSLARLARSTEDVATAQSALTVAMNISAATGKDIETISAALGKAYDGNTASLGRLGLGVDSTVLKSKDMNKIMTVLRKNFAGFAEQEAKTAAGGFNRLKVAADEASEVIGVALIDAINKFIAKGGGIDGFTKKLEGTAQTVADIIASIGIMFDKLEQDPVLNKILYLGRAISKVFGAIVNYAAAEGKQQRINLALQKSKTTQIISARNAEYMALKNAKEAKNLAEGKLDVDKKSVEQLMAEEAAKRAGFKITEDIDSIQTVAAANRLAQIRTEKFESIDLYRTQIDGVNKVLDSQKAALDSWLAYWNATVANMKAPAASNYLGIQGTATGGGAGAMVTPSAIPAFVPAPVAAPMSTGTFDYLGVGASGGSPINLTINNAGSVLAEQDLQNAILEGIQRVQYYGANPILPNGGR